MSSGPLTSNDVSLLLGSLSFFGFLGSAFPRRAAPDLSPFGSTITFAHTGSPFNLEILNCFL
jgi:hypothetical protein